jgi:hypothetical protein
MCVIDWTLILRFVDATAGPAAGVVAVWLAARLAVAGFKSQKAIERRLDWYERMHRAIAQTKLWYARSAVPEESITQAEAAEIRNGTHQSLYELMAVSAEAAIYAQQAGSDAVANMRFTLGDIEEEWEGKPSTVAKLDRITALLQSTSDVLANEVRVEMKLGDLVPPKRYKPLSDYVQK